MIYIVSQYFSGRKKENFLIIQYYIKNMSYIARNVVFVALDVILNIWRLRLYETWKHVSWQMKKYTYFIRLKVIKVERWHFQHKSLHWKPSNIKFAFKLHKWLANLFKHLQWYWEISLNHNLLLNLSRFFQWIHWKSHFYQSSLTCHNDEACNIILLILIVLMPAVG